MSAINVITEDSITKIPDFLKQKFTFKTDNSSLEKLMREISKQKFENINNFTIQQGIERQNQLINNVFNVNAGYDYSSGDVFRGYIVTAILDGIFFKNKSKSHKKNSKIKERSTFVYK
jgi:hypothetical protein